MWKALLGGHAAPADRRHRRLQKPAPSASPLAVEGRDIVEAVEDISLVVSLPVPSPAVPVPLPVPEHLPVAARAGDDDGMTAEAAAPAQPLPQPRGDDANVDTTIDAARIIDTTTIEIIPPLVVRRGRDEGAASQSPSPFLSRSPPPALIPGIPESKTDSTSSLTLDANSNSNSNSNPNPNYTFPPILSPAAPDISPSPSASCTSLSIYPPEEFRHMALDILKRTRAKTPCFWVGQLDHPRPYDDHGENYGNGLEKGDVDGDGRYDSAIALACEYQAMLPPRTFTPGSVTSSSAGDTQPLGRTIRKVKGRQSLREIVERDESVYSSGSENGNEGCAGDVYTSYNHYTSINIHNHYGDGHNYTTTTSTNTCSNHYPSDSDTLIGSDSPRSPLSLRFFPSKPSRSPSPPSTPITLLPPIPPPHDPSALTLSSVEETYSYPDTQRASTHASPAFQLCLDLLTAQLAQGLFRRHPAEPLDRASGLQIRLMIEAYEGVLESLLQRGWKREEYGEGYGEKGYNGEKHNKSEEDMQDTLRHWIAALYEVYEQTVADDTRSVDSWASCRSEFEDEEGWVE